jgi:chemotaxis protein histidine kinase CheA
MANKNIQELKFQVGEAWKSVYSSSTAYGLANVVQDATGLSIYRSLKSGNVGHPLTDANWWFCIIDMSSIKAESDRIAALNQAIAQDEALRVAAEELRQQHEAARVEAEIQRNEAEQTRISAEQARVNAESARATAEQQRIAAEQGRVSAESARVQAEQARVLAETLRANAEDARAAAETNRAAAEQQRIANEQTRIAQEQQRETKEAERQQTFVQSQAARQQAYEQAEAARNTTFNEHEQQRDALVNEKVAAITELQADVEGMKDGSISVGAADYSEEADNLSSWKEENVPVDNNFNDIIRTAAGIDTIDSAKGGTLISITPVTDFRCDKLIATGENQLLLASNGGAAVAVGNGWYFPVPELVLGTFGTMNENNGLILVAEDGSNITTATVRFKPLADGVPTSENDGVAATSQNVTYDGKTYKVYTTPGPGYIIVSDITYAETCARIAWEDWYDRFVSPTDPDDGGGEVNLAPLFATAPNGTGKFLVLGSAKTHAERTSSTNWTVIDPIGLVAEPVWTTTEVVDSETQVTSYLHSTVIDTLGSQAIIEGADIALTCNGTTASYSDNNAEAATGSIRYEKAVPATANVTLDSEYDVNDVGVEMKTNVTGEATFVCEYAQNVADALANSTPMLAILRTNVAAVSLGRAICPTPTYDAAKAVTIPHFVLLINGIITVLFTTPVNVENATMNVNMLGAYPIKILGQPLPAGFIKAESEVQMVFDGTAWNITQIFQPQGIMPADILVDMGLPSGVKWASRDIDLTKAGGFCDTPFTYEKSFFSWGNIDGHNPISNSAFDYNWGGVNAQEPWYDGQPYGSTPGNTLTGNIAVGEDFDAARANLGGNWRMPARNEFVELFSNIIYIKADGTEVDTTKADKRVMVNGVLGLYIQSNINGARLFFSCSGYGYGRSWDYRGSYGYYWSSTFNSARGARYLYFYSGGVYPQDYNNRCRGFALRPVQ